MAKKTDFSDRLLPREQKKRKAPFDTSYRRGWKAKKKNDTDLKEDVVTNIDQAMSEFGREIRGSVDGGKGRKG